LTFYLKSATGSATSGEKIIVDLLLAQPTEFWAIATGALQLNKCIYQVINLIFGEGHAQGCVGLHQGAAALRQDGDYCIYL
jgi:hypothetical protein